MKKIYLLLLATFIFNVTGKSQTNWFEMMGDPNVNFYTVKQAFNTYFQSADSSQKGKGWKQYKRWEWMMGQRLYPSGDRTVMNNAIGAYNDQLEANNYFRGGNGNWSLVGPSGASGGGGGAGRLNFVRFDPANSNNVFVGAPAGGLWKSTNSGTSWANWNTDLLPVIGCSDLAIDPTNSQIMYLATGDGDAGDTYSIGVLKSLDGGLTWNTTGLNWAVTQGRTIRKLIIHPTNNQILVAATSNGIYRTTNGGTAWTQVQAGSFFDVEWRPGNPNNVYACTDQFYRSTDAGATWTNVTTGLPASANVNRMAIAVTAADNNYVYILCSSQANDGFQGLYRSTNTGTSFSTQSSTPNVLGWSTTGNDVGGQGWYDLAIAASPTSANTIYVGGVNIWRSTNGGTGWTLNAHWYGGGGVPYVHADIHDLIFLPGSGTTVWSANDGGVYRTTNSGTNWSDLSTQMAIAQQYRLGTAATNNTRNISGHQDNGTNRGDGAVWSEVLGGDGMECIIDFTNANIMYGSLYYGEINRSTNGGGNWSTIANTGGTGVNGNGDWVTPYVMHPTNAATLIVGKNGLYRTTNSGGAWTALGATTGGNGNIVAIAYAPSNPSTIYAAKYNRIFRSTNGGTSFTDITGTLPVASASITYIAVDNLDANNVYVTFSGYSTTNKVFNSTNGGSAWTNISSGLPNLPVNCIVYQNGTADGIYVGTDVGVYYRDNTIPWTSFNNNLPNVIVSELEIQYGTGKLRAATYGRSLWESDLFTVGTNPPTCAFTPSATTIQAGQTVNFTDNSTNIPTAWNWTFGGGGTPNTSTQQSPSGIQFNTPGTYNVQLIASNVNGSCTTTVAITVTAQTGCDTLNYPPPGTLTVYTSGAAGKYVCGWNQYGDSSKAHFVGPHAPYTHVNSMLVYFYGVGDGGNGASVDFRIWNNAGAGGTPGAVLANVNVPLTTLNTLCNGPGSQGIVQVDFPTAVNVGAANFYIGIRMNDFQQDDSLGIVSNTIGDVVPGAAWEQWDDLTWHDVATAWGGSAHLYMFISPLMTNLPPTANMTANSTTICAGESITYSGTTSVNAQAHYWTLPGGTPNTGTGTSITTTYNTPGTYSAYLEVTGVCDGYSVDSMQIIVNANPNVGITPAAPSICQGQTVSLTASGGTSYTWSPSIGLSATTGATVTAGPATTTTYTVSATNAAGCTSTGNVTVTITPGPTISTTPGSATICAGGSVSLTASGGTTYSWAPTGGLSSTTTATTTASPTSTTTYTVSGTTAGCTGTDTVTVTVVPLPVVSVTPPSATICSGNNVSLTASGATTYSWSPATGLSGTTGPTVTASPTSTQTYTVTGTSSGCNGTANVTVTVNTTPTVNVTPAAPSICTGASTVLTASGASTYTWSPATGLSATTGSVVTANPTTTTTYTVIGTTGSCSSSTTVTVTVTPGPSVSITPPAPTICAGASVVLTASGATTYSWSPATGLSGTTTAIVTASPTSTQTYTVTGTTGGCTGTANVTVTVTPLPVINITPPSPGICTGQSVVLTASGATTYSWSPATGLSGTTTATVTASPTSTQTYTVTGTQSGCVGTGTVTVNVAPSLTVSITPSAPSICSGGSVLLTASGAASYAWSPATGLSSTITATTTASPSSTQTYTVTGTSGSCTGTANVTVTVNTTPVTAVTPTSITICEGASTGLTASGATTYSWSPATGLSGTTGTNVTANPTTTTTYTITGTTGPCSSTATTTVTVTPLPVVSVTPTAITICAGTSTTLTASGATTYSWSPATGLSGTTGAIVTASPTSTQTYTVTGTQTGCTNTATATVTVDSDITVSVTPSNPSVCQGNSVGLTASGATSYTWSPATGLSATTGASVTATPPGSITYTVIGTSGTCDDTLDVSVSVNSNPTPSISQAGNVLTCNPAGSSYQWYMSTDSCATWAILAGETNQTLTITQNGSYYVEMTDANSCTGSSAGCFTANYDAINELNSVWNMMIVPNPNSGIFEVRLTTGIPGDYTLEICDEAGRVVFTNAMGHVQKTANAQVDISHHQRGIYLLKLIQNDKAVAVKRIMKM